MHIFNGDNPIPPEKRREKSNDKIKKMGIACFEELPVVESSLEVKLKSIDVICKRALANLLAIQLACDIGQENDYDESKNTFLNLLKKFEVENCLLPKEKRLFDGNYTMQDAVDVAWTYECYWSLVWSLGFVKDEEIEIPDNICDCTKAVSFVISCSNFDEFKNNCNLKDTEKILDMLDLYYRYDWACVHKRIKPETPIGVLNPEVVNERRRGLEWLFSKKDDWFEISLDT